MKMAFRRVDCISEHISLNATHCVVKLRMEDGKRFGQRLRDLRAERELNFNGSYRQEAQEFHFNRCHFVAVNTILMSTGLAGNGNQLIPEDFRLLARPASTDASTQTSRWHQQEETEARLLAQEDTFVHPGSRKRRTLRQK